MHSPAAALRAETDPNQVWVMCFNQRRDVPVEVKTFTAGAKRVHVTLFPPFPSSGEKGRWAVAGYHATKTVQWMREWVTKAQESHTRVFIEDYAFAAVGRKRKAGERDFIPTNCITKLAEDAGIVKEWVWDFYGITAEPVAIGKVKLTWAAKGNATKAQMQEAWVAKGWPDLTDLLGAANANPYNDVVDAVAVMEALP